MLSKLERFKKSLYQKAIYKQFYLAQEWLVNQAKWKVTEIRIKTTKVLRPPSDYPLYVYGCIPQTNYIKLKISAIIHYIYSVYLFPVY